MVENTVSGLWFNSQLLDTSQIEKFYHNGEHIMWQILLLLSLIIHDSIKQKVQQKCLLQWEQVFSQSSDAETRCEAFHSKDSSKFCILK